MATYSLSLKKFVPFSDLTSETAFLVERPNWRVVAEQRTVECPGGKITIIQDDDKGKVVLCSPAPGSQPSITLAPVSKSLIPQQNLETKENHFDELLPAYESSLKPLMIRSLLPYVEFRGVKKNSESSFSQDSSQILDNHRAGQCGIAALPSFSTAFPAVSALPSFSTALPAVSALPSFSTALPSFSTALPTVSALPSFSTALPSFSTALPTVSALPSFSTALPAVSALPSFSTALPAVSALPTFSTALPAVSALPTFSTALPAVSALPALPTFSTALPAVSALPTAFASSTPIIC